VAAIKFTQAEKSLLIEKFQRYFSDELDRELGQFEADFLLDFITEEMGAYFYNRGLYDAQAVVAQRAELIVEAIAELEQATPR
jgi:uncharacterized protein (DUF2164 family)